MTLSEALKSKKEVNLIFTDGEKIKAIVLEFEPKDETDSEYDGIYYKSNGREYFSQLNEIKSIEEIENDLV